MSSCLSFLIQTTIHSDGLQVRQSLKQATKRKFILTTSGISNSPLYTPFLSTLSEFPSNGRMKSTVGLSRSTASALLAINKEIWSVFSQPLPSTENNARIREQQYSSSFLYDVIDHVVSTTHVQNLNF